MSPTTLCKRRTPLTFLKLPAVGVVHLPALLGFENCPGMNKVLDAACQDVMTLEKAGFDAVLIENEYDQPYHVEAPPETIAAMAVVAREVVQFTSRMHVGVEILLNDPGASIAVAKAACAHFIRTDYFVDRMAREEYGGEMKIDPEGLMQYREKLEAKEIEVLADIQVKYARLLEEGKSIGQSAAQARSAGANAVIVSGIYTGQPPEPEELGEAQDALGDFPLFIGSGITPENIATYLPFCSGFLVGTGIMKGRKIDYDKASGVMEAVYARREFGSDGVASVFSRARSSSEFQKENPHSPGN